jgi:hypothetical protein
MLNQVADGVWVRQSEWVRTNSIVVPGAQEQPVGRGHLPHEEDDELIRRQCAFELIRAASPTRQSTT